MLLAAWALASSLRAQTPEPRFNEVFRGATHNSYWVQRGNPFDFYASGTQERLLDQLLFDHVRALELDIHKDDDRAGQWKVYHTDLETNVLCSPLAECLKQLRQFQYALPKHEAVVVVLELKELLGHNFDEKHTPRDLDALLEQNLGPYLYRPKDLLTRCAAGSTLRDCVRQAGWPTTEQLRGRFLFTILGTWRWHSIGHGPAGWAEYATWNGDGRGAVEARSAWPMENDFTAAEIPPAQLRKADASSVFLQIERFGDSAHMADVKKLLAEGVVVRAGDSQGADAQAKNAAWGAQMAQTEYPWIQYDDRGAVQPYRPLRPERFPDASRFDEPGERLLLSRFGDGSGWAFACKAAPASTDWETLPSSTRPSPNPKFPNARWTRGQGCLRAEGPAGSFQVCRQTAARRRTGDDYGEDAVVTVETVRRGRPVTKTFRSGAHSSCGVGDQLRMKVEPSRTGACAVAYSASEIDSCGKPQWKELARSCFPSALPRQGVAAKWGDVLFVHTRMNGKPVKGKELAPAPPGSGYALTDQSR